MSDDKNPNLEDIFPAPSSDAGKLPGSQPFGMDQAQADAVQSALFNNPSIEDSESLIDRYVDSAGSSYSGMGFTLSDEDVLCTTCKHSWLIRKHAQVKNLDVDGKPFMAREGYCMATPQSLFSLGDRFVLECNLYEKGGKRRTTMDDIRKDKSNGTSE
tara:strand:+ start:338 stop:811 length:474 start_codon:yes stop_codon:yes gene_type:complete